MRSKWIEHKNAKIFYQDFSDLGQDSDAVLEELKEVQAIVTSQPKKSALVLSNFINTEISSDLFLKLNNSSDLTKDHVKKTAVLGVTGIKRTLADLLRLPSGMMRHLATTCRI